MPIPLLPHYWLKDAAYFRRNLSVSAIAAEPTNALRSGI